MEKKGIITESWSTRECVRELVDFISFCYDKFRNQKTW